MELIAEGQQAVLDYLQAKAYEITGHEDTETILYRDDNGCLYLALRGFNFVGEGSVTLGGKAMEFKDGKLVRVDE